MIGYGQQYPSPFHRKHSFPPLYLLVGSAIELSLANYEYPGFALAN